MALENKMDYSAIGSVAEMESCGNKGGKFQNKRSEWVRFLFKELYTYEQYFTLGLASVIVRDQISMALGNLGFDKTEEQIKNAIDAYIKRGGCPTAIVSVEDKNTMQMLRQRYAESTTREKPSFVAQQGKQSFKLNKTVGGRVVKRTAKQQGKSKNDDSFDDSEASKENEKKIEELQREIEILRGNVGKNEGSKTVLGEKMEMNQDESAFMEVDETDIEDRTLRSLLGMKNTVVGRQQKYHLKDVLGFGTFGVVFQAVEEKTGKRCAIKCVADKDMAKIELNTMKIMNKYHPEKRFLCVPSSSFKGIFNQIQFQAFSMELLNVDLFSLFFDDKHKEKAFPSLTVLSIMGQVFSAIAFLNEKGFIYADLKHENVMLQSFKVEKSSGKELIVSPVVRLIDLNAMLPIDNGPCICQTVRFRAPETILRASISAKIDCWSMGILASELLMKDKLMDFEYMEYDGPKTYDHIARIQCVAGEEIPEEMWDQCEVLDRELVPEEPEDQLSVLDVLDHLESSMWSDVLQEFIPRLLKINPCNRPSPSEAYEYLKDIIPS